MEIKRIFFVVRLPQLSCGIYESFLYKISLVRSCCFTMNFSEEISFLFSCNVSPSATPQLDISVTKSEPLRIAVPMTIFYGIIFLFGV